MHFVFIWNNEIIQHLAEHGVSQDDFESVVSNPLSRGLSRSTGLPVAWGHTRDHRYIMTVYEQIDPLTILPVTAYEVPEPK
jgi:hypothetical protein